MYIFIILYNCKVEFDEIITRDNGKEIIFAHDKNNQRELQIYKYPNSVCDVSCNISALQRIVNDLELPSILSYYGTFPYGGCRYFLFDRCILPLFHESIENGNLSNSISEKVCLCFHFVFYVNFM